MAEIDAVVFDVGRVLIDFSYERFFELLGRHGARFSSEDDFAEQVGLNEYEHGWISDADFLNRLKSKLDSPLTDEALIVAWNELFTPVSPMLELARQLKNVCGVYLLSNTSAMHWAHLQQTYALAEICHDLFASYQVGQMKPAAEIFHIAEQRFGLTPERTLFIDDKQTNVAGAIACGWQGLWHRSFIDTRKTIFDLVGSDL